MNKTIEKYGTVLRIYDAGIQWADRYTILPPRWAKEYFYNGNWCGVACGDKPLRPQGIGYHVEVKNPGKHLGKRIHWDKLPMEAMKFVMSNMPEFVPNGEQPMIYKNMPMPEKGPIAKIPNALIQSGINAKRMICANV